MADKPIESLSDAIQETQRVQLAIDVSRLKTRQAQVVQAKRVWADGQSPDKGWRQEAHTHRPDL